MKGKVTVPSKTKSDNRMEFGLGFSDELLRTSLMVVWDLMKPSWCPIPNANSILRATHGTESSQPISIVIIGVMMAIRWLEAHVKENNRQEAPTKEQLEKMDCPKILDLF